MLSAWLLMNRPRREKKKTSKQSVETSRSATHFVPVKPTTYSCEKCVLFYRSAGYAVIDTLGENKKSSFFGIFELIIVAISDANALLSSSWRAGSRRSVSATATNLVFE